MVTRQHGGTIRYPWYVVQDGDEVTEVGWNIIRGDVTLVVYRRNYRFRWQVGYVAPGKTEMTPLCDFDMGDGAAMAFLGAFGIFVKELPNPWATDDPEMVDDTAKT